jgi:hypothetical protein
LHYLQVEETVEFKRKAKFLLSFMHPALVPAVIDSVQCNVSNALPDGEMTTEEARAVLGLVCEV